MRRQHLFFFQMLIILVLMAGCSSRPSESKPADSIPNSPSIGVSVNHVPPTESELEEMLNEQQHQILWCAGEFDCFASGNVEVWGAMSVDYEALWQSIYNTVFESVNVLGKEDVFEATYLTLSNGVRCEIYEDSLSLVVGDETTFLDSTGGFGEVEDRLLDALSSYFTMELKLSSSTERGRIYSFYMNEISINEFGYGYRNGGFVPGAFVEVIEESDRTGAIMISLINTPDEIESTYSNTDLIEEQDIIRICTADLVGNYPDKSVILVIEDAVLTYSLEPNGNRFVPMIQLLGYSFDGEKWEANRIINALTGEIFWN